MLIAIEIFVNIVMYLREDIIHVKIVVATGADGDRAVIILDFKETSRRFCMGNGGCDPRHRIAYWLLAAEGVAEELPPGSKQLGRRV